ncbi:MAG TPA: hypothetical protein VJ672_13350 [Gemmatimonadaceae bacterium]|nr:hypothetical protein [Gemmatimonadaceae bacterium]
MPSSLHALASGIDENASAGVCERVNLGALLLWLVSLAVDAVAAEGGAWRA